VGTNATDQPGFPRRGHLALLAIVYACLVVYGSLVPLDYRPVPWDEAVERFWNLPYLDLGIQSRADWVANLLLFIPIAWLAMASLTLDRGWEWRWPAALLILPGCFALALAIEFTQIQFPARTTSLNDIIAETLGGLLGVLLWLASGQQMVDWFRRTWRSVREGHVGTHLLPGYIVLLLLLQMMPFDFTYRVEEFSLKQDQGRVILVPFAATPSLSAVLSKAGTQLLYFGPLGFLLAFLEAPWVARRGAWWAILWLGFLMAALCETVQLPVFTRTSDTTDIVLGTLAVLVGWRVGLARAAWWPVLQHPAFGGIALVAWGVFALFLEWWPFNFIEEAEYLQERWSGVRWVLFADYYAGTDYNAFNQFVKKTLLFLPLGLILGLYVLPARRLIGVVGIVLIGFVASLTLEAGQLALPGRFASFTDVLVETLGCLWGALLARSIHTPGPSRLVRRPPRYVPIDHLRGLLPAPTSEPDDDAPTDREPPLRLYP
jgi:glycopeptide antibiotics resistance protein